MAACIGLSTTRLRESVRRFSVADVKTSMQKFSLREGLIYTYLDNVLMASSLMTCPCGETFDSRRLEHTVIHVPHITAAETRQSR